MPTLKLTLNKGQVTVRANEAQSHSFSLHDLRLNDAELKAFVQTPRPYGSRLFQALFKDGSAARTAFDELSKQTARTIVLVLDSPELDGVAWEYAYNEVKQEYVVEDCAFMRALPESERPANGRLKESVERVSLLFIPANPLVDLNAEPMRALDVDGEWREMTRHITASHAPFDLLQLRPATPEQLQTSMARFRDGLAVHFSGHGAAMKDGTILLFERENGASNPLEAQEFIRAVKDKAGIVFLSACQTAAAEKTEFGNLARGLVKSGVPFALGMQFNLPDPFAPVISGQFYNWLAQGHAIPEATMQARRAVKRENEFFVGMIALYAAHPDETGEMNWRGSGASLVQTVRPADVSDLPSPASGLIGRQRELMRIGTQLIEEKKPLTVTLHGAGGIGKTALLWQSLLRFAPSFDLTLALALDPLPSLESILGRIERFLGLPSPCANETKERETLVRARLTSKRTLLGLDNFETLNYALNEKDSDEEKTSKSLYTFFKSLAANGVTLCVTSREVTNLPGETIEDIQGLTNENGGRLFQENVVRQKDEIYIEKTQQVSEMVGGHPLALRLLASAFDDQVGISLDQYIEDLQSHLPKARDKWTEEDRHESLRASFDFTMRNLVKTEEGKELQIALSRLSVFTSFFIPISAAPVIANKWHETEDELKDWGENANKISHMLWKHGLLERTKFSPEENSYLYRLHSVLRIFAKERLMDIESVTEYYQRSMGYLAMTIAEQRTKSPQFITIALHSLPDLILASESQRDSFAAPMLYHVGILLQHFGLYDDAKRLLAKSYDICVSLDEKKEIALVLHELANIHTVRGNLDDAMKLYTQALEIKEGLGDLNSKSPTLAAIASIEIKRGNLEKALALYQEILDIAPDLDRSNESIASSLHQMAGIYAQRGDLDKALNFYMQSLKINERLGDLNAKSTTLGMMAQVHVRRGNLDKAMELFQQSLEIHEGLGDLRGKAEIFAAMPRIFVARGDLDKAMKLYTQALKLNNDIGDSAVESTVLSGMAEIASIHVKHGDLDEALNLLQKLLEITHGLGDLKNKSVILHNMASIFVKQGFLDDAAKLYQQSLEIKDSLGDQEGKAVTLGMISEIDAINKNYGAALTKLLDAMNTLISIGADSYAQAFATNVKTIQSMVGYDEFLDLWKEVTNQNLPHWLSQHPQQSQGITIEQFIAGAIQSAREKRPEAEQYFKEAQRLAGSADVTTELQELGKVLQKIMLGAPADLSMLTGELRKIVEKILNL